MAEGDRDHYPKLLGEPKLTGPPASAAYGEYEDLLSLYITYCVQMTTTENEAHLLFGDP